MLAGRELAMAVVVALGEACRVVRSDHPVRVKALEVSDAHTVNHVKLLRECTLGRPFLSLSLS